MPRARWTLAALLAVAVCTLVAGTDAGSVTSPVARGDASVAATGHQTRSAEGVVPTASIRVSDLDQPQRFRSRWFAEALALAMLTFGVAAAGVGRVPSAVSRVRGLIGAVPAPGRAPPFVV